MKKDADLLNNIYQNSQMGVNTMKQLIEITEDDNFKKQLEEQYREYKEIRKLAEQKLNERGYDEKGINTFDKIKTYLMINFQTLTDKSTSHIAEMLMVGSMMGIINAVRNLKEHKDCDKDILDLMERLLKFEEHNIQKLKEYL